MPFQIIRDDIVKVKADAIVNTANPNVTIGNGIDSAIYRAAGEKKLLEERRKIGVMVPGEVAYTPALGLDSKYILHVVGPVWIDGKHGEGDILKTCYERVLEMAVKLDCESIAIPLIATGSYGFPKDEALQIALATINRFLLSNDMNVILVVFDQATFTLSGKLFGDIEEFIDEHYAQEISIFEYGGQLGNVRGRCTEPLKSLDEMLKGTEDTFQQRLFHLIDASGMDDVMVYKKANIDRKVFSRIRCKVDYKPKKKTAVALAIALELDMPTMLDLLARAEIAFSPSNRFDLIITYFVTNKVYDIYEINAALFKYDQQILGE